MIPEKKLTADSETGDEKKAANNSQTMSMKCMAKSQRCIQCQSNPKDPKEQREMKQCSKNEKNA